MRNELPSSCCAITHTNGTQFCNTQNSYRIGCAAKIQEDIKKHSKTITIVVILFGIIEVNLYFISSLSLFFKRFFFSDCGVVILMCVIFSATRWIRFSCLINPMIHPFFRATNQINLSISNSFDY